jgi:hypothetical protein
MRDPIADVAWTGGDESGSNMIRVLVQAFYAIKAMDAAIDTIMLSWCSTFDVNRCTEILRINF